MSTLFCLIIIVVFVCACCAVDHQADINSASVYYRNEKRRKENASIQ